MNNKNTKPLRPCIKCGYSRPEITWVGHSKSGDGSIRPGSIFGKCKCGHGFSHIIADGNPQKMARRHWNRLNSPGKIMKKLEKKIDELNDEVSRLEDEYHKMGRIYWKERAIENRAVWEFKKGKKSDKGQSAS